MLTVTDWNDLVITDPGATGGMAPTVNVLLQNPASHGNFSRR